MEGQVEETRAERVVVDHAVLKVVATNIKLHIRQYELVAVRAKICYPIRVAFFISMYTKHIKHSWTIRVFHDINMPWSHSEVKKDIKFTPAPTNEQQHTMLQNLNDPNKWKNVSNYFREIAKKITSILDAFEKQAQAELRNIIDRSKDPALSPNERAKALRESRLKQAEITAYLERYSQTLAKISWNTELGTQLQSLHEKHALNIAQLNPKLQVHSTLTWFQENTQA
jgi:hypothetical protein